MKRLEVSLSKRASADLAELGSHIYRKTLSASVARAYTARITAKCAQIGDAPLGGRLRDEIGADVRSWTFERRAVILYRVTSRRVVILRIAHRGRHLQALP